MEMHHRSDIGLGCLRPMQVVIDGEQMFRRQIVAPFDEQRFAAARLKRGSRGTAVVAPHARGRQIPVDLGRKLAYCAAIEEYRSGLTVRSWPSARRRGDGRNR